MPTNIRQTDRRGFLATVLGALGLAKYAKGAKSKIGPKPLMAHVSEIGEWPEDDASIKAIILKSRQLGVTPTMIPFSVTHAKYMEWVKSPEYQNSPKEMFWWVHK